jgi:hypothetical protein
MAFLVPNSARINLLSSILSQRLNGAFLCTFKSAHAPAAGDTLATYTAIENAYPGYSRKTLNAWGAVAIDVNGNAEVDETTRTFTATAGSAEQSFGYFIIDATGALLLAEQDITAPIDMTAAGRSYSILPKFYLGGLAAPF